MSIQEEEYLIGGRTFEGIDIFNSEDLKLVKTISEEINFKPVCLKCFESTLLVCSMRSGITIVKFESLENFKSVQLENLSYCYYDLSMDFSKNFYMICSAYTNYKSSTVLMNAQKKKTRISNDHSGIVRTVAVSEGLSNRIVSGSNDSTLCIKNIFSLKNVKILKNYFGQFVSGVLFSNNEKKIIAGSYDQSVKVVSLIDYQIKKSFKSDIPIFSLNSFEGSILAGGNSNDLYEFKDLTIENKI